MLFGIMLIQGLGGPRSGNFLVFLTSKSESLGQKTYSESRPIQSDEYFLFWKWLLSYVYKGVYDQHAYLGMGSREKKLWYTDCCLSHDLV